MNKKDRILKTMVSNPNSKPEIFYSPKALRDFLFPTMNIDQVEFLIKEIIREKPELLKDAKIRGEQYAVRPTGLIEPFLKEGGFTRLEKERLDKHRKQELRETKSDALLDLDLKLKAFDSKIGKKLVIAGLIIMVLNFIITILTLKIWGR